MMRPREYAKATNGALIAGLLAAGTALTDGHITALEGCGIAVAALGAFGVVFGTDNKDPE